MLRNAPDTAAHSAIPVALATLALTLTVAGCKADIDRVGKGTIRVGGVVANDFEAELSALGYSLSGESDYTSLDISGGVTYFEPTEGGGQKKVSRADLLVATSEFEDLDAIEIAGGGRFFFGSHRVVQPFLSTYAVGTILDDVEGFEVGTQLGLRAGGGVEFALGENFFADIGVDYTIPLIAAESDTDPLFMTEVETELSGWAVRVGIGVIF